MEKKSVSSAIVKSIVLVILGAAVVLGVYLAITRTHKPAKEESYKLTVVDEITTTDLDKNYPADPRMVIDLYSRIMKILYKETYTEEQEDRMLKVLAGLMDEELMANQSNFAGAMKGEVELRRTGDYSIATYEVQSRSPDEVKVGGRKMCNMDCTYYLRKGTGHVVIPYHFVMRQDDQGRWKILGWTVDEEE